MSRGVRTETSSTNDFRFTPLFETVLFAVKSTSYFSKLITEMPVNIESDVFPFHKLDSVGLQEVLKHLTLMDV